MSKIISKKDLKLWNSILKKAGSMLSEGAEIMSVAWEMARESAAEHGGKPAEYFKESLKAVWKAAKEIKYDKKEAAAKRKLKREINKQFKAEAAKQIEADENKSNLTQAELMNYVSENHGVLKFSQMKAKFIAQMIQWAPNDISELSNEEIAEIKKLSSEVIPDSTQVIKGGTQRMEATYQIKRIADILGLQARVVMRQDPKNFFVARPILEATGERGTITWYNGTIR